ncbi:3-(3-hydroxy-phenyl)propionate transporter MhpT [Pseudomonas sp. S37]|uniref:3-(3-hydroxy-phenyl)propionate transporter MhpT n=1 Tax=Pseudomonas sp. S37 TaxID=2767449 RepID=UPI001913E7A3|nr:3-(3-hydroxy-phenyl)propionate transporter MhpT [Pseudomonas sp. S37]MBK4992423.1 3-(3-hydroxy-phenyl)propionate transporter MhpT [Pseudomonas sp. S37]
MPATASRASLTVVLCFLVALIEGLDLQSVGIAASGIKQSYQLDSAGLGWVFSAGLIGLLPGSFYGGLLADRLGRKTVLIGAVMLFGIFSIVTVLTDTFASLIVARLFTGIGLGAALPNLIALCAEAVDERKRSTAVSIMYCGVPLGGALASLLGVSYGDDWRLVFVVGGVAPLLIVPMLIVWLQESTSFQKPYAIDGSSTLNALCGAGRMGTTLCLWISYFFTLTVMYMLLNWLPSLLLGLGFNQLDAAQVQVSFNIGGAIGSLLGGFLLDRFNKTLVICFVYAGLVASLLGVASVTSVGSMLIVGFLAGGFVIAAQLLLYATTPSLYPTHFRATGVGAAVAIGRLGSVAGPLIAGQILAAGIGSAGVIYAATPGVCIAAAVLVRGMSKQAV